MSNSDRRHFLRLSVITAGVMGLAGVELAADPAKPKVYVCPPCGCGADDKDFPAPGACPSCGMPLIEKTPAPKRSNF